MAGVLDRCVLGGERLVHLETQPARRSHFSDLARPLPEVLERAVPEGGFWSHQAEAIDAIRSGSSTVVATGTASGKSLCYQLPIAEAVVTGARPGTSLLIYPTKALAHDQLRAFEAMGVDGLVARTYDGDADREERSWARARANVILTNPEMLHYGILPHHQKWATFLRRLSYVVVDELHVFRGIFGSHLAHVLRRLRRLCEIHGSDPTFVFTSATIGEPEILAEALSGRKVTPVIEDGSPRGCRHIGVVQPALVDTERGRRQSTTTETIRLVTDLVRSDRRVIAFCPSRSATERVAAGVQRALPPELAETVRPYRAGYLAEERRAIEDELAAGTVRAVITTSALELGVDIDRLDATVLSGFPGTIASLWQQVGRAGRSRQESVAVLVAGDDQLDQWFARHPTELFTRPPEPAVINPENPFLLDPHLECAAFEAPLERRDERWWPDLDDSVRRGVLGDRLRLRRSRFGLPKAVWAGRGMPFHGIGLRSAGGGEVKIRDLGGSLVGTVERSRATALVHPGAVYLHRGQPWRVVELDLDDGQALVDVSDGETWTMARTDISLDVIETAETRPVGAAGLHRGRVLVTHRVTGYQVRSHGSRDVLDEVALDLPPETLDTTAVWYDWPNGWPARAGIRDRQLPGALHAAEHCAIGILPLFTICDRWDVGGVSIATSPHSGKPSVFIYDGYPGGAGIADLAYEAAEDHLRAALDVLRSCPCVSGCPSCVQSPKCGNGNEPLDKAAATALLETTLGPAEPF